MRTFTDTEISKYPETAFNRGKTQAFQNDHFSYYPEIHAFVLYLSAPFL
jgi:hypothetical protein